MPLANLHPLPNTFAISDTNMDIPMFGQALRKFQGKPFGHWNSDIRQLDYGFGSCIKTPSETKSRY